MRRPVPWWRGAIHVLRRTIVSKFSPGQTVGIVVGVQTGHPHIGKTGTFVREVSLWRDTTDYVVNVDGEELVYSTYLIREV
jgi:hypothetical protein